jgi:tetratricopeptide (TPR) repeat protein
MSSPLQRLGVTAAAVSLALASGCAAREAARGVQAWPHAPGIATPAAENSAGEPRPEPVRVAATAGATEPTTSRHPPEPEPEEIARAEQLVARGVTLYRKGDYDEAEKLLKQAMAVYPFVAEGNLTLGKIFLIRGSATRDSTLIDSARLMFEMARAMGGSREADMLLELFRSVPE